VELAGARLFDTAGDNHDDDQKKISQQQQQQQPQRLGMLATHVRRGSREWCETVLFSELHEHVARQRKSFAAACWVDRVQHELAPRLERLKAERDALRARKKELQHIAMVYGHRSNSCAWQIVCFAAVPHATFDG